jgi:hypothetical protein
VFARYPLWVLQGEVARFHGKSEMGVNQAPRDVGGVDGNGDGLAVLREGRLREDRDEKQKVL